MKGFFFESLSPEEKKTKELEILKQKIDQYRNNFFYTVGNPIQISDPYIYTPWEVLDPRRDIPEEEIYNSFVGENTDHLKLFKTEEQALEYSRSLRTGNKFIQSTIEIYQPAIFKVIYLGELNTINFQAEEITINPESTSDNPYNLKKRTTRIEYFETERGNIVPTVGCLKVHLANKNEFKIYEPVHYDEFGCQKEKSFSFCFVS